jgi:hypothetical protein
MSFVPVFANVRARVRLVKQWPNARMAVASGAVISARLSSAPLGLGEPQNKNDSAESY